jgi:endonuclease III
VERNPVAAGAILEKLAARYAGARTELRYESPFQLLVAVILSAQTTDRQVNRITAKLFQTYQTPADFAALPEEELAEALRGCGLYRNKARHLIATSRRLLEDFQGQVPETLKELLTLPGVGRKTANVVLSEAFGVPALAVDTHVFRVAARLGLARGKTPGETEALLKEVIPEEDWGKAHHWLIQHGRRLCSARTPNCRGCFLLDDCPAGRRFSPSMPSGPSGTGPPG